MLDTGIFFYRKQYGERENSGEGPVFCTVHPNHRIYWKVKICIIPWGRLQAIYKGVGKIIPNNKQAHKKKKSMDPNHSDDSMKHLVDGASISRSLNIHPVILWESTNTWPCRSLENLRKGCLMLKSQWNTGQIWQNGMGGTSSLNM